MSVRPKGKKGGGKFVRLPNSLIDTPAWAELSCAARSVHVMLVRRHNGGNNGRIYLPSREAAKALTIHKNTVLRAFKELEASGFIASVKAAHLGSEGTGRATEWRLTHLACEGKAPSNDFLKKQNPGTNIVTPWSKKAPKQPPGNRENHENVVQICDQARALAWSKNVPNLTSSHTPYAKLAVSSAGGSE